MNSRRSVLLSCLAAGTLSLAVSAVGADVAQRPNVLLITIDTLRPDALGWVGASNSTPTLDRLAATGFATASAVAPAPLTLPAHASMFSGLVPRRHGVRDNHQVVGAAPALLAERLQEAGYQTAAVISGYPLTTQFGLDRGFDHYDDRLTAGEGAWLERPADETTLAARAWVSQADAPWFLWVHYYDPHLPYEPPTAYLQDGERGAYDGEVAWVDSQISELLAEAATRSDDLLTVVTGDHGEALGEHGEGTHGYFVYDDTVLVPLIIHRPGSIAPARSAASPRLVDLGPTILDLLDLAALPNTDGVSLAPLLRGSPLKLPPAYLETLQPWYSYGWAPLAAVRHEGWKLIAAPRPELFDLTVDPDEAVNLYGTGREAELELRRALRAAEALQRVASAGSVDSDAMQRLRSLGYLGSGANAEIPPRHTLADPKDQADLRQRLTQAAEDLRQQRFEPAIALLEEVIAQDATNRFAQSRIALAYWRLGNIEHAKPAFEAAIALAPEDPELRATYAELLTRTGRPAAALPHWLETVRLQPERVSGWANLGAALGMSGDPGKAADAYRRAAELEPGDADRWVRLAFADFAAGRSSAAIASLEHAASMQGEQFGFAGTLGLLLQRTGRSTEAASWLQRSRPPEVDFGEARLAWVRLLLGRGERAQAVAALLEGIRLDSSLEERAHGAADLRSLLP